jgi:hypothetical protein
MRPPRVASRLLLAGVVSAALGVLSAGCSHTVAVGSTRTLRLGLTEYRVVPQSVRAQPGELTLIVTNDGRVTHNLAITAAGKVLQQTPPIAPGESTALIVYLGKGSYVMTSTLFSDQALGTYGTLNVG